MFSCFTIEICISLRRCLSGNPNKRRYTPVLDSTSHPGLDVHGLLLHHGTIRFFPTDRPHHKAAHLRSLLQLFPCLPHTRLEQGRRGRGPSTISKRLIVFAVLKPSPVLHSKSLLKIEIGSRKVRFYSFSLRACIPKHFGHTAVYRQE